jgi:hypothetical protein
VGSKEVTINDMLDDEIMSGEPEMNINVDKIRKGTGRWPGQEG